MEYTIPKANSLNFNLSEYDVPKANELHFDILGGITIEDQGIGEDLLKIKVLFKEEDSGQGQDEELVIPYLFKKVEDRNLPNFEVLNIKNYLGLSDTATGQDIVSYFLRQKTIKIDDEGIANELTRFLIKTAVGDTAQGSDSRELIRKILIDELGLSQDEVMVTTGTWEMAVSDEGIFEDAVKVIVKILTEDDGEAKERLKGRWNEWLCKTYSKKGSPYGLKDSPYSPKDNPYSPCA